MQIEREVTPISDGDFFIMLNNKKAAFDYPPHFHPEYELNIIKNVSGKRYIGDSIEDFNGPDIVLVGPNVSHKWNAENLKAHVITIQFQETLFHKDILARNSLAKIRQMLENSKRGIVFSQAIAPIILRKVLKLDSLNGFDATLEFLSLLHDLAISEEQRVLISLGYSNIHDTPQSRRILKVTKYISENYLQEIKLSDLAIMANMSETAFSSFFKKHLKVTLSDYILDYRIGHACKLLSSTNMTISEICYTCGFNNLSNFNRIFKKRKQFTPSEFRNEELHFTTR